jgi:hypothetical protein
MLPVSIWCFQLSLITWQRLIMKNKMILGAVLVGMVSIGQAFGAAPLAGAQITGLYNGDPDSIFGADFLDTESGSQNVTGLAAFNGLEFITGDSLVQIDFNSAGLVTFTVDGVASAPANFTFDFGSSLSSAISGFAPVDVSALVSGSPVLSVLNDHKISASLGPVVGSATGYSFTSQITFASAVPEPVGPAMLVAGLGLIGLIARKRNK